MKYGHKSFHSNQWRTWIVLITLIISFFPISVLGFNDLGTARFNSPQQASNLISPQPLKRNVVLTRSDQIYKAANGNQVYLPIILTKEPSKDAPWPMVAANPQRTSWSSEEVAGKLHPLWYRQIEPYILPRVQVIAAYDTLFISTARGLCALDEANGQIRWIYPTSMPLGHSPAIIDGVAYVGGFDHKLHAINAFTGQGLWTFEAQAGFDTNPLVINNLVYIGNRDGNFYAIHTNGAQTGQLAWKYKTGGPIHFSAAYDDNIVYFASDDSFAYALNAVTGELIWKSAKLPGAGFHSWWPMIYNNWVIFAASDNYRNKSKPGPGSLINQIHDEIFPNNARDPRGVLIGPLGSAPGNWVNGTPTIDISKSETTSNGSTRPITEYLEEHPWQRSVFVLDRVTGKEYTSDFDHDGKSEYAPIVWFGVRAGNRYPPILGGDTVLYQPNEYLSNPYIHGGHISGWKVGTPFISVISSDWTAVDEPIAYSAGGNMIYWKLCCDRQLGTIDLTQPNTLFAQRYNAGIRPPTGQFMSNREWLHVSYNLPSLIPGYDSLTYVWDPYSAVSGGVYGGANGSYGWHGDENPPIPYKGKLFTIHSNTVVAYSPQSSPPNFLPIVATQLVSNAGDPSLTTSQLETLLANEVSKMIAAGHLRPGWGSAGLFDSKGSPCLDTSIDYWSNPSDTIYTLLLALPYLPSELQQSTSNFIQKEFNDYPPYKFNHIGWASGANRDTFDVLPEVQADLQNYLPQTNVNLFEGWKYPPQAFYAMWKYAQKFGEARAIFDTAKNKLNPVPSDAYLATMPHVHNAYIAGYFGYLELEALAGYPQDSSVKNTLTRLLSLRATTFTADTSPSYIQDKTYYYCRALNTARNFMFLVPELGQYLHDNAYTKVENAVKEFEEITPYWFVTKLEVEFGESTTKVWYDYPALFQAKAWILQENQSELTRFIDVPSVPTGDLYYIQNLVAAIQAGN